MIEEMLKELDKDEERTLNKVEFNKFKQLVDMVVEYGTLTNTESYILIDALNKIALRRKKAIKERTEKDLEVLEKELEKQLGKEGLEEIKTAFGKIEGEITKTIKNKIEKDKKKIIEKIIEEENLSTFIATFRAGQENEGKYLKIYCEGYDVAVSYMEKNIIKITL